MIYVLSNTWNQQIQLIPSFLSQNNMVPLLYKDGIQIFKSLDKTKCGFLPTLRGNHISVVQAKWMWIHSYIEMYPHLQKSS